VRFLLRAAWQVYCTDDALSRVDRHPFEKSQALAEYEATAVAADAKKTSNLPSWLDKEGVSDLLRYGVVSAVGEPADEQRYSLRTFPVEKMLSAVPLAPVKPTDSSKRRHLPHPLSAYAGVESWLPGLLAQIQTAIETTTDPGVLEALNSSRTNVDNVLTKDVMYRIEANTALYDALLLRINSTNDELKTCRPRYSPFHLVYRLRRHSRCHQ